MLSVAAVALLAVSASGAKILEEDFRTPAINAVMIEEINVSIFLKNLNI